MNTLFNVGYLFLQSFVTELRLDKICRSIKGRHKYQYDLLAVFTDLILCTYSLHPSSKRWKVMNTARLLLNHRSIIWQDVYRALSVIAEESDFIQSELYQNSNLSIPGTKNPVLRLHKFLFWDWTGRRNCANTVKEEHLHQIQSWLWVCSWMQMGFLCLSIFSLETKTSRPPLNHWNKRLSGTSTAANLFFVRTVDWVLSITAGSIVSATELMSSLTPEKQKEERQERRWILRSSER